MLRNTSAMSCKVGTHTLNIWLCFWAFGFSTAKQNTKLTILQIYNIGTIWGSVSIPMRSAADRAMLLRDSRIREEVMGFGCTDIIWKSIALISVHKFQGNNFCVRNMVLLLTFLFNPFNLKYLDFLWILVFIKYRNVWSIKVISFLAVMYTFLAVLKKCLKGVYVSHRLIHAGLNKMQTKQIL